MDQFARTWAWTVMGLAATIVFVTFSLIVAASLEIMPVTAAPPEPDYYAPIVGPAPLERDDFVRFVTYNIRWGLGTDGVNLARTASVLNALDADVVLLTEVDVNWRRSGNVDQPAYLSHATNYPHSYYGPALKTWSSGNGNPSYYGNLLLSRFPIVRAETIVLPHAKGSEPRAVIVADIVIDGEAVTVLGTHLGLSKSERMMQLEHVRHVAGTDTKRTVLLGDFNARPESDEIRRLTSDGRLVDTQAFMGVEENTFPYPEPYARIDYIFVSPDLADSVISARPVHVGGSDHLPVTLDLRWPPEPGAPLASDDGPG